MDYDQILQLKSRAQRLVKKDPKKALELTLSYLQAATYDSFVEQVLLSTFSQDNLSIISQIVNYCPYEAVKNLPDTNETIQYKAQLSQNVNLASQTDYFVNFKSEILDFQYIIQLLSNLNFLYAHRIVLKWPQNEQISLIFQICSKKHENAFKLFKSKFAVECRGLERQIGNLQQNLFCNQSQEGIVMDDDELD